TRRDAPGGETMRKPNNIVYGTEQTPPGGLLLALGIQQALVVSIFLVAVAVIVRAAQLPVIEASNLISLTLMALVPSTLLQIRRFGPIGSGLLAVPTAQSVFVPGCVIAARAGGLPMVAGLLFVSSFLVIFLSRFLRPIRGILPTELSGLIVLVTGLGVAQAGMDNIVGAMTAADGTNWVFSLLVAVGTLGVMVGFSVWGRGPVRTFGAIIGLITGYLASVPLGLVEPGFWQALADAPWIRIPLLVPVRPAFSTQLLLPALLTGLSITLNSIGALTAAQRLNDADWRRQDLDGLSRGLLADGLGTMVAALLGGAGVSASGSSVGLTSAARATSRAIGYVAAGFFLLLSLLPMFALLVVSAPRPVLGAALVFLSCSLLISGISIMSSRLLDARKTFCLGIAFAFAVATPALTRAGALLPVWMSPVVAAPLLASALVAILLNPILRLGIRQQVVLDIPPDGLSHEEVAAFISRAGAGWGARRDTIAQAQGPIVECLDTIIDSELAVGAVRLTLGFNELQIDARITWHGTPLPLSKTRPTKEELLTGGDAAARMAGYLIGRLTSRVTSRTVDGSVDLHMIFDH
ncbi:MAG: xanthine permease XanP, partial [Acetobacteraceae bacterium]|nr:xanthine permease XanP [Acetobacteraceae bacterium]